MSELYDLYQDVILDHNKNPRNFGKLEEGKLEGQRKGEGRVSHADGYNPLCGDRLTVYVALAPGDEGEIIRDIKFEGSGCAISKASASLMTEAIKGKPLAESERLFASFHELLTGDPSVRGKAGAALGKLAVFEGVREYPVRVKCATLAWHTLQAALAGGDEPATTE
ncbi:MAG: SUF system NifU family Fe-S cluster assembly protein [Acidobacteriota bacterium]|nr:SUF system NifU family Fe-S cluster assembly protein [Acidobacteriota bacterium]